MLDDTTRTGAAQPPLSSDENTAMMRPDDATRGPRHKASLVVLAGWEIGREIALAGDEHLLGRSSSAHTQIDLLSVSREHAKIERIREGDEQVYRVTDVGSSNGTFVNNEKIQNRVLRNGDKIQVGEVTFRFVVGDEGDARIYRNIHHLIYHDQLTGLLTMDAFRNRLDVEIRRVTGACFSIAMTDLDGLKKINDMYGHLAGRMTVREMGLIIRQSIRPEDVAALYGGDETAILFPNTGLQTACQVAEAIRIATESKTIEQGGHAFKVTMSLGLAEWPRQGRTVEAIIGAADAALYAAKAAGRNRVCCARNE